MHDGSLSLRRRGKLGANHIMGSVLVGPLNSFDFKRKWTWGFILRAQVKICAHVQEGGHECVFVDM